MKKIPLFILILTFLVFSLAGIAYSWQGRMAGMGDPYGLIMDESDFLIHPAGIAKGEGIKFYGHYRFNYTDVRDWKYTLDLFDPVTRVLISHFPFRASGDEQNHEALVGAAFPVGLGRMAFFFQYAGKDSDFTGHENALDLGSPVFHRFSMDSDLDSFALRLLYGLPMGGFKLGGEIQLAYRNEENKTFLDFDKNKPFGVFYFYLGENLFPFIFPYDSKYWEAVLKGSLKGAIGPAKIAFTIRGGYIFGGDNKLNTGPGSGSIKMDGEVKGWNIGSDLWMRVPLAKGLSVPMLVKVDYQKKTRDGDGPGFGGSYIFDYKNGEKILKMEAGAGLDKEFAKGSKIAAGIYYGYLRSKNDYTITQSGSGFLGTVDHTNYPDQTEHRVILRLVGEKEFSSMFAMRMGLSFFYGWVKENLEMKFQDNTPSNYLDDMSLNGNHWGIGASLGATVKFQRFCIEPFLGGGYQKFKVNGDGFNSVFPAVTEMDKLKKEWSVGGGLSVKF